MAQKWIFLETFNEPIKYQVRYRCFMSTFNLVVYDPTDLSAHFAWICDPEDFRVHIQRGVVDSNLSCRLSCRPTCSITCSTCFCLFQLFCRGHMWSLDLETASYSPVRLRFVLLLARKYLGSQISEDFG